MKVADIIDKLPLKVKLTDGFKLEESFDTNTILEIIEIKEDSEDYEELCYQIVVIAKSEDLEYNKSIAKRNWFDFDGNTDSMLDIYEANKHNKGDFTHTIYVMENDDWFIIYNK